MYNQSIIKQNEQEVNGLLLRNIKWLFLIFPLCIILNVLKIMAIPWDFAILICATGIPLCAAPLIYHGLKGNMDYFKYVVVFVFLLM